MTTTATGPADVSIRRAERADLFDVSRIEKRSFPQPWPFQAFERFLGEPGFLVAAEPPVVGYIVAETVPNYGGDVGHVKDLAVHPERRGRGVGSRLLDRALSVLAARGARNAKLEVRESNERARALYERFGFEPHHVVTGYYENDEDAIVLVTDLASYRGP